MTSLKIAKTFYHQIGIDGLGSPVLCNGPTECPQCALKYAKDQLIPKTHTCSVCGEKHTIKDKNNDR